MIDVQRVLDAIPHFDTFCSVEKLHGLVETVRRDPRFEVNVAGTSVNGVPIHLLRCGQGSVKALIVGGPHAHEPIGSLTVFGLLSLLSQDNRALLQADVEWYIVPCIDPDGAILNEGWTQKPFTFESFVRNFYLQFRPDQVDFSFPISHQKLVFNQPSQEAKVLQGILERVQPDFFFSLHNSSLMGGAWFLASRDFGQSAYAQIYQLLEQYQVPLKAEPLLATDVFAEGVWPLATLKQHYDFLERQGLPIPEEYLQGRAGASSQEYLFEIKPSALSFIAEFTYGKHPGEVSARETGENLRQMKLRLFADNKFLAATLLEEWEKVKEDLEVTSPFYRKIFNDLIAVRGTLHEGVTAWYEPTIQSLLFDSAYSRRATERDRIEAYRMKSYFLGNAYTFVRLLKASKPTRAVREAIERLERVFEEAIERMKQHIGFEKFEVIDCDRLAKVQLGSGLIALNTLLETQVP